MKVTELETPDINWWIKQMKTFEVRVNAPAGYFTIYNDVQAPNYSDAERKAKQRFCDDFGYDASKKSSLSCWTFNKQLS